MDKLLKECEVIASPSLPPVRLQLPFYSTRVPAGFPSPAEDHLGDTLDLNELLVRRPAATFFVRVRGESMIGAGIFDGDILVVDRSLHPTTGQIIVAALDGELTVKTFKRKGSDVRLLSENPEYPSIEVSEQQRFEVWGVVSGVVRELVRGTNARALGCLLCTRELPICLLSMYIQWHETANLAAAAQL